MNETIDTREKILDISEELFFANGYENTPVSEILKNTGIAKGTLYHHFLNKEQILDEVIKRQGDRMFSKARRIAEDKSIPADKRLIMTLMAMQTESAVESGQLDNIHHPQNALLHEKINDFILEYATPFLSEIIKDGNKEKVFDTPYPKQVVEMILIYVNVAFDHLDDSSPEELKEKIEAFIFNIYRLTGAKDGSLDFSQVMGGING